MFQNSFISTGADVYIDVPADTVKIEVMNKTAYEQSGSDLRAIFIWNRGYTYGQNTVISKLGAQANEPLTAASITSGGIYVNEDINFELSAVQPNAITNISAGAQITSVAHGLLTGDVVRLSNLTGAKQLEGIDFYVTRNDPDNFTLTYFNAGAGNITAAAAPGAAAAVRKVKSNFPFKPLRVAIAGISKASQAVVTVCQAHGYSVGQKVLMRVPAAYGMVEMDSRVGTIQAVTASTFTLDINSSSFTAFAFPATAAAPFDFAEVSPYGDNLGKERAQEGAATNPSTQPAGRVFDNGMIRVLLTGGATGPAGAATNVIYWNAYQAINLP